MMLPVLYKNKKLLWLQPGDVVLFRSDFVPYLPLRYVSAGVRGFTGVNLNHAGQIVSSWGRLMINEAKGSGVISRPLEYYLERYRTSIVILRPKKAIVEKEFCIKANDKLGTHYDLASLLIHQAWYRITGEWIGKTGPAADNAMECAEYVAWCHGRPDPYLYSVRELLLDDYFEIIYEEIPIKIKNPPMESLPPAGNHIQGACYGLLSIFSSLISIWPSVETIIRMGAGLAAIISAIFAARYYHVAYLEKKETRKHLKSLNQ